MSKKSFIAAALCFAAVFPMSATASAQTDSETARPIHVMEVSGYIDPTNADFLKKAIATSEKSKDAVLVVQLDSHGSLLSKAEFDSLLNRVETAKVPIAIWVGGVGAQATNEAYRLAQAADIVGVAPATAMGDGKQTMTAKQALESNAAQINAPVLQQFVFLLDGKKLDGQTIHTARRNANDPKAKPEIESQILFLKPTLTARLMHTAASPSIAYLFLVLGLCLLIFEFFSLGVGIAAGTGLLLLIPAAYGLDVLPVRAASLAVLVLAFFAFSIDIQAQASKFWTVVGTVLFVLGSLFLYDGVNLPLLTFIPVALLVMLFVLTAMPSTIRSRFLAPTAGRDWLIGEMGTAKSDVNPDGVIDVRGGTWTARTNRSTPIAAGARVRVLSIEGSVLEVEPEVGGARESHH